MGGSLTRAFACAVALVLASPALVPTPAAADPWAPACARDTAADTAWVQLAYWRVMTRPPDDAGVAYWTAQIAAGLDYNALLRTFAHSDDRLRAEVAVLYGRLLDRAPDPAGLDFWINVARRYPLYTIVAEIAGSDEYLYRHGGTIEGAVSATYEDVLLRLPEPAGVAYWSNLIRSGYPRSVVAAGIGDSFESRQRIAEHLYAVVLQRTPDPAGRDWLAGRIGAIGPLDVSADLAASPEFWAQAQALAGRPATPFPPPCPPPPPIRWLPPAGVVTTNLAGHPNPATPLVALTFDDGPNAYTAAILDILRAEGVPATFFVVGGPVNARPDTLRRIVAEGHAVAAHTMTHSKLTSLSAAGQANELYGSVDLVESITGPGTVHCVRPPYGAFNATTTSLAGARGLAVVTWSRDTNDWRGRSTAEITATAIDGSRDRNRGIVLMHDKANTVAALPTVIAALRAQGSTFVTVC